MINFVVFFGPEGVLCLMCTLCVRNDFGVHPNSRLYMRLVKSKWLQNRI